MALALAAVLQPGAGAPAMVVPLVAVRYLVTMTEWLALERSVSRRPPTVAVIDGR